MSNLTINKHTHRYTVFDKESKLHEFRKDSLEDMTEFVEFLIDELDKANDKQSKWFESYWRMKRKINKIADVVNDDD